jgi:hypothetical protein
MSVQNSTRDEERKEEKTIEVNRRQMKSGRRRGIEERKV